MGQFDQTVDEEGVTLTPDTQLDPTAAIVPPGMLQGMLPPPMMGPQQPPAPMPTPPVAPPPPGNAQHLISMALLGLAAGLGPRHAGGGVARGLMAGQDANEADRRQQFKDQQEQYVQQQNESLRRQAILDAQAKAAAAEQVKREQMLQQAIGTIRTEVKTLPDKAAYDQRIEGYANLLQGSGYRIDANRLRSMVPYIAPSQKQKAQEAVTAFFKNPINAQMLKDNPGQVAGGSISFDANGDGVAEVITLRQLLDLAGMSVISNDKGQPLAFSPSTTGDGVQLQLKALTAKFRAENHRDPNEQEWAKLVTEARTPPKAPKEAGDVPMVQVTEVDPDTGELVTSLVPKKAGEISRKPPKEPNQAQFQAGAYAGRMEQSAKIIDSLEKPIASMNMLGYAAQNRLPSAMQTDNYQSFDQAARNFINAVLRKESGATITPAEFDNARKQYLPVAGDTTQTLAQKKANRDYALKSMKASAGRAYEAPIDVPNADDAIIAARKKGKP